MRCGLQKRQPRVPARAACAPPCVHPSIVCYSGHKGQGRRLQGGAGAVGCRCRRPPAAAGGQLHWRRRYVGRPLGSLADISMFNPHYPCRLLILARHGIRVAGRPPFGPDGRCRRRNHADTRHCERAGRPARQVRAECGFLKLLSHLLAWLRAGLVPHVLSGVVGHHELGDWCPTQPSLTPPTLSRFRYMASLRLSDAPDRPFCGGTLIHPRVVLTAAHVSLTAQQPQGS